MGRMLKWRWAVCSCGKSHYGQNPNAHANCKDCDGKMNKRMIGVFNKKFIGDKSA